MTCHDVCSISLTKMLNILPAIFEKYTKTLLFHTFCENTHINWLNPVIWLLLITCDIIWSLWVRKKWEVYQPFVRNVEKSHFVAKSEIQNWLKPYHVTTLITHHDVWSVSMDKKLNVLPAVFEKYPKMLLFYTFSHITHMNWLKPCHLATLDHLP